MADGIPAALVQDGVERASLADEARLIRRVRLRLVLWSGLSTLLVLMVLGAAIYAAVASTLVAASVQKLTSVVRPVAALYSGQLQPDNGSGNDNQGGGFGFQPDRGGFWLFAFTGDGQPVGLGRQPVVTLQGMPEPASLTAANLAANGLDVREITIQIGGATFPARLMTQSFVASADKQTYFLQALVDRTVEVETLQTLLTVLLVGGGLVVVVSVVFGYVYARRAMVPIRESLESQRTALRRQREFAADASHELRTPLTVIRSSVEHLQRHPERRIADQREALDDIDAEVGHLATLVDDLLILARSDSGAVALEVSELDLGDIAFDAASAFERTASDRGVTVGVDPEPVMVRGDAARLRQMVMILVDNAVRHSPRGGRVDVTVRQAGGLASVEVADRGPGLREADMPHVFDRFWRAPGAPSGGTGLGLAIARWIVDSHGGRIGVANRAEGGAVFRAELPAASADVAPAPGS